MNLRLSYKHTEDFQPNFTTELTTAMLVQRLRTFTVGKFGDISLRNSATVTRINDMIYVECLIIYDCVICILP